MAGRSKSMNVVIIAAIIVPIVVLSILAMTEFDIATLLHNQRVEEQNKRDEEELHRKQTYPPSEPNPERIVKTPRSPDYDEGYKCHTAEVEFKGYTITFWTLGSLYSPGNPFDGFLRIEATAPRAEKEVDQFRPRDIHVAALRFTDRVNVREDDQQPHFYHVRRDRLGLEAHLVDMVSTSSTRIGRDRANWLPPGQYLLEVTLQLGTEEVVRIKDIYIEVGEPRLTPIFDPERLRKASQPLISIPAIRGGPIDEPKKPNPEGT